MCSRLEKQRKLNTEKKFVFKLFQRASCYITEARYKITAASWGIKPT